MGGLARICKGLGGLKVTANGRTVEYVWDYVLDKPLLKSEQTHEMWLASEKQKWGLIGDSLRHPPPASPTPPTESPRPAGPEEPPF